MGVKYCYNCMRMIDDSSSFCSFCGVSNKKIITLSHQLPPNTVLRDRYLVGKNLGEGGFGITYIGKDTVLDTNVAIKEFYLSGHVVRNNTVSLEVTNKEIESDGVVSESKKRFLNEARVLAKFIDEKGIVSVRDYFEENNTAYIIMDYIDGISLKQYVKKNGRFEILDLLGKLNPILNSLNKIHHEHIIHRDISPDNIMMDSHGELRLLDFGAAREVFADDPKSLSVILKPGYAPEEQYRKKGVQGPWTDIYALCATIYYCTTGIIPDTSVERVFEDDVKPLCRVAPSCPSQISDVIMKGMSVRREDRFASISDFLRALTDAENGRYVAQNYAVANQNGQSYTGAGQNGQSHSGVNQNNQGYGANQTGSSYVNQPAYNGNSSSSITNGEPSDGGETVAVWNMEANSDDESTVYVGGQSGAANSVGRSGSANSDNNKKSLYILIGIVAAVLVAIVILTFALVKSGKGNSTISDLTNKSDYSDDDYDESDSGDDARADGDKDSEDGQTDESSGETDTSDATDAGNTSDTANTTDETNATDSGNASDSSNVADTANSVADAGDGIEAAEEVPETIDYSSLTKIHVVNAIASYLPDVAGDGQTYEPAHLIDNDYRTGWIDGIRNGDNADGVGETILLELDGKQTVSRLVFYNGYLRTKYRYTFNGKVNRVRIEFEDGTSIESTLNIRYDLGLAKVAIPEEDMCPTTIDLDRPVQTSWVKITILGVTPGERYHDTGMSEIELY